MIWTHSAGVGGYRAVKEFYCKDIGVVITVTCAENWISGTMVVCCTEYHGLGLSRSLPLWVRPKNLCWSPWLLLWRLVHCPVPPLTSRLTPRQELNQLTCPLPFLLITFKSLSHLFPLSYLISLTTSVLQEFVWHFNRCVGTDRQNDRQWPRSTGE